MTTTVSTCLVGSTDSAEIGTDDHAVLLQRVTQGEPEAFWALWKHFEPVLRHRCLKWMGGNHADAEDALSGASLRAWQYLSSHASEIVRVKPWLFRLVHNHCMSQHKRHQMHLRHLQPMRDGHDRPTTSSAGSGTSFEEAMLRKEMVMLLRNRINALPSRLREPVILYFFHDMRHRDIALHLHLTPENVRKRLQHARTILRTQLSLYTRGDYRVMWKNVEDETASTTLDVSLPHTGALRAESLDQLASGVAAIRVVRVVGPKGTERYRYLALDTKPTRQQQKLATLRAYVQRHPTGWRKRLQLADLLCTVGQWQEAVEAYQQVLLRQPHSLAVWLRLGHMLHRLRRNSEAVAAYQNVVTLTRNDATRHHVERCIALCRREMSTAVESFVAATSCEPLKNIHWHTLGRTYVQMDHTVEALSAFDRALEIDPQDVTISRAACVLLSAAGRRHMARRILDAMLQQFPSHWSVCATAGRILQETFCETRRACTLSARGVALQPDLAPAWIQHGRVLMLTGQHKPAITALEHGWARLPDIAGDVLAPRTALWLGACYRVIGDEDHSQSWWRKAVQCSRHLILVHPAMGHYWLGKALGVCGQWKNARQAYRAALQHHVLYPVRHEIETVLRCKTPIENTQPEEEKA